MLNNWFNSRGLNSDEFEFLSTCIIPPFSPFTITICLTPSKSSNQISFHIYLIGSQIDRTKKNKPLYNKLNLKTDNILRLIRNI